MNFINERLRFHIANIVAVVFLGFVAYSGFAYPLHYGQGYWPFNCDWFMFSYDTGYDFELEAIGKMRDGSKQALDVTPYFSMPVGSDGNRFQEVTREIRPMRKLARYLCQRFPIESVTILDVSWVRTAGKRFHITELSPQLTTANAWVTDFPCGS